MQGLKTIRNQILTLGLLAQVSGCGEVKDAVNNLLSFDIDRPIPEQTIPGQAAPCQIVGNIPLPLGDSFKNITIEKEEDFPEQNTEVDLIKEAYISKFDLAITAESANQDWDFLDNIAFTVSAEGQETVTAAILDPVEDGLQTIALSSSGVNLAPYLKAEGGFTMNVKAEGCPPNSDTLFTGIITIGVSASPL